MYKIYEFTLRANLNIQRLALYVLDETWQCKIDFGTEDACSDSTPPEEYLEMTEMAEIEPGRKDVFGEFNYVLPVSHKNKTLAIVFVGGLENKKDDVK